MSPRFVLAVSVALLGCQASPPASEAPPPGAVEDEAFIGKADGGCAIEGTPAETGVLALVNDPGIDAELLDASVADGGAGLYRNAAYNIVDARPIADLQALDDVPWVGRSACEALADFACNVEHRCRRELSAMSWNVEHFPLTEQTEDAVVEVLLQTRPALVGLQEIEDVDAFERVLDRLPGYEGALGEEGPFTRVAALWRTDVVSLEAVEHHFVEDWYAFPRPMLALEVTPNDAVDPQPLTFAVVHLKASGGESNEARRRNAVGKLRDWIDGLRGQGRSDVVIVGDWNDELLDPSDENVFGDLTESSAGTRFLTEPIEQDGGLTYVPWKRMLDHVLTTEELSLEHEGTEVLALDETWRDDYVDVVSDHRPVVSTFSLAVGW